MIEGGAIAPSSAVPCKATISFADALEKVVAAALPIGEEIIGLEQAAGRVLAQPVLAHISSPRIDVAAMDGYAVQSADLDGKPVYLQITGQSLPGQLASVIVETGQAVRIFTGAPIPAGADCVVMQEYGQPIGDGVILCVHATGRSHVRKVGCDFSRGQTLLPAGRYMDVQALMVAGAADCATLSVWRQPRVAIVTTGDELVRPGEAAATNSGVPDSVSLAIRALCCQAGGTISKTTWAKDDAAYLRDVAASALDASDVLVLSGGASVGDHDLSRRILRELGMDMSFAGVAMKPAKPLWYGRIGAKHVIGLPGNPAAALMAARLFLVPLLHGISGRQSDQWNDISMAATCPGSGDRDTFLWARQGPDGLVALAEQQASMQHMLAQANTVIHLPRHHPGHKVGMIARTMRF